jgi:DDE superfamily endonuclease
MVASEAGIDARRLVFVDEMGTNTSLAPLYGWSRRGGRAHLKAPRNWGANLTLLASITPRRDGALLGSRRRYYPGGLRGLPGAPPWRRLCGAGQIVVMDNLTAQKGGRVKDLVEGRGCELLYLPPYSPDLNPIEQAFSKVKGLLCGVPRRVPAARS